jgi:hypothetical protein
VGDNGVMYIITHEKKTKEWSQQILRVRNEQESVYQQNQEKILKINYMRLKLACGDAPKVICWPPTVKYNSSPSWTIQTQK